MSYLPCWVSDLSSIATLICFVITLYQLKGIKKETDEIQQKLQKALAISDISRACEIINSIDIDFTMKHYDLAHHRMQEVRNLIIEINEIPGLKEYEIVAQLDAKRRFLDGDIQKFKDAIFIRKVDIPEDALSSYSKNLDEISKCLLTLNAQLKNVDNGK